MTRRLERPELGFFLAGPDAALYIMGLRGILLHDPYYGPKHPLSRALAEAARDPAKRETAQHIFEALPAWRRRLLMASLRALL